MSLTPQDGQVDPPIVTQDEHGQTTVRLPNIPPADRPGRANPKPPDAPVEQSPAADLSGVPLRPEERQRVAALLLFMSKPEQDLAADEFLIFNRQELILYRKAIERLLDAYDVVAKEAETRTAENIELLNKMVRAPDQADTDWRLTADQDPDWGPPEAVEDERLRKAIAPGARPISKGERMACVRLLDHYFDLWNFARGDIPEYIKRLAREFGIHRA